MMDVLETAGSLENRSGGNLPRWSRKIALRAGPAAKQARLLASATASDQDPVVPNDYYMVVGDGSPDSVANLDTTPEYVNEEYRALLWTPTPSRNAPTVAESTRRGKAPAVAESTRRRKAPAVAERFWLLNRWQGQVLTVAPETFEAQLFDPKTPSVVEHAEFSRSELSPDGLALLRPGAVFYWIIGYRDSGSRQRVRESVIWMRRSGRMGQDKFKSALDHVEMIWGAIAEPTQPDTSPR